MLRSLPTTLLVCIVLSVLTMASVPARADDPDKALDVLLKPSKNEGVPAPEVSRAKPSFQTEARRSYRPRARILPYRAPRRPITKVKAPPFLPCVPPPCILPQPRCGQWEMTAAVIWARVRGSVAWPRYGYYYNYGYDYDREADLTDDLQVPKSQAIFEFTASYQFRPSWALRYSLILNEANGGGRPERQFRFGPSQNYIFYNDDLNTKWEYGYQSLGLVYTAVRSCSSTLKVYADWLHSDDKISVNCSFCGNRNYIFSVGGDSAIVGLELDRCLQSNWRGGTFSLNTKAGFIFLDDVEGWDIKLGMRYSIPLGCGRGGFLGGGYRYFDYKKSTSAYLWKHALEGGYLEMGFVF